MYRIKKNFGTNNFSVQFSKIIFHIKRLVITLMYCDRLHACWSTQSWLTTWPSSLIAHWWDGPQALCDALHYLLDNIFIRFGSKLYSQIVSIPMGTNCAPLVADLFLFCYKRDFMLSLSDNNQADVVEALNSTSRYLDDLLNINNPYFEQMVSQIYPTELHLNKPPSWT